MDAGDPLIDLLSREVQDKLLPKITPAQIDDFERHLARSFTALPDRATRLGGVDYDPDSLLDAAAAAAGLDVDCCLPIKSAVAHSDGKLSVKIGYGAPWVELPLCEEEM